MSRKQQQLLKNILLVTCIQAFGYLQSFAQEERYIALPLTGTANQIATDSTSIVQDTVFFNLALRPTQTTYSVTDNIIFKINEFANLVMPDSFKVTITFKVYFSKLVGSSVVQDSSALQTVFAEYNKTRAYQNKAVYTYSGGYKSQVKIFSVTSNLGTFSAYKNVLMLENEIVVNRLYNFNPLVNTVQSVSGILGSLTDQDSCSSAGEYMISWGKISTCTEYDLEWTYVDSSALANYYKINTTVLDTAKIFRNNASRVTITKENFQVPLLYDNGGTLFYRVRPVQVLLTGQRIEGLWSSNYTAGLGAYGYNGHEKNLNWQATTSYAEEGKRKSVVQYFDGTLRNRQTVTKDNNTCYTIVAESIYDYQGRPVIQVMPAPTLSRMIGYTANFTRTTSNSPYDKTVFDGDATAIDNTCSSVTPGMGTMSGASLYYSPSNNLVNTGFNKYIPDANLYPFTETRYTPDNTGRVSMQSGVGKEFAINNTGAGEGYSHETRYFYASADQEELDALFGTEAGNASHYSKNMVRDANGQYSVSYVDMHGRTIATALAGKPIAKLDSLNSSNYKLITKKLVDSTNNLADGTSIVASKNLLVTRPGSHRFQYSLATDSITLKACNGTNICYDCYYDLEITVSNDCANPNNQPIRIVRSNFSLSNAIDTLCNTITAYPAVDTSIYLSEGSYTITKKLTLNANAIDAYREIFLRRNTCRTLQQIVDSVKSSQLSKIQCVPTCSACLDSLGTLSNFRIRYMTENGILPADSAAYREQAIAAYNEQLEMCNNLCEKNGLNTSIRKQMLADMTYPYGQYALLDSAGIDKNNIFYRNTLLRQNPMRFQSDKSLVFKNEQGIPDSIYVGDKKVPPTDITVTELIFANNFKASWAEALLPLHPEYCKLAKMESYAASYAWDERFAKIETYQQAVDSGFLNPFAVSPRTKLSYRATFNPPSNTAARDPFFTTLEPGYVDRFQDSLLNYTKQTTPYISAWSVASIMATCGTINASSPCVATFRDTTNAFNFGNSCTGEYDMAWATFREMYLNKKQELIDGIYKSLNCGTPDKIWDWHNLNFNPQQPVAGSSGIPADSTKGRDSLNNFLNNNCSAYVAQWMQEMKPCNLTATDSANIIPRLIAVCQAGSDETHLFGSNTTRPGTVAAGTYPDTSFTQVLKSVLGSRYDSTCNAFLITAPLPYTMQPGYSDIPVYTKPDSCQCNKINGYYAEYQRSVIDASFAAFIYRKTGTKIYAGVLDSLRMLCNGQITCKYQPMPLMIPKALQCNVAASACATCTDVNGAYSTFQIEFPGIVPSYSSKDSVQIKRNRLFEKFMNQKLGLAKSGWEYLQFLDKCNGNYFGNSCDTLSSLFTKYMTGIKTGTIVTDLDIRRVISPAVLQHLTDLTRIVDTGVLHYPDSVRFWPPVYYNHFNIAVANGKTFCTSGGFETEFKFKFSVDDFPATEIMYLNLGLDSLIRLRKYGTGLTLILGGNSANTWPEYGAYTLDPNPNAYLNWMTFRLKRYPGGYELYFNNNLVVSQSGAGSITNYAGFTISYFKTLQFNLDWIKIKDNSGNIKYFEDYNNPYKPAVADSSFICPSASGCFNGFVSYFNSQRGTTYTFNQIDSVYYNKCGIHPVPCDSLLPNSLFTLCNSESAFPPADVNDISPCADSTLFSVGVGTKLYEAYTDSLTNNFNNLYLAKCLKVKNTESFTVTAPVSEFHYTLYYYDQAGNLVKTIPPAGVDVSKFGWASLYSDTIKLARKNNQLSTPAHVLATHYRYNSLNKVVQQYTPDAGLSAMFYDKLGRLVISQNARQKALGFANDSLAWFSYTVYDVLGRIAEVGEVRNVSPCNNVFTSASRTGKWISDMIYGTNHTDTRRQLVKTYYDNKYPGFVGSEGSTIYQRNLRSRVSYTYSYDSIMQPLYNASAYYSYDISGNVDTLLQDFGFGIPNIMQSHLFNSNRYKRLVYRYDLISGKVNHVAYQPPRGKTYYPDMIYHRYSYDAENRIILAETSTDSVVWERDGRYDYYLHGPLARTTLGDQLVQGIDYAYTLQGWLKGANAINHVYGYNDIGKDGNAGSSNQFTARDAFGFNLNYFGADYKPINSTVNPFPAIKDVIPDSVNSYRPLFNGNISSMAVNIVYPNATAQQVPQMYNYKYDQLNRITQMDVYRCTTLNSNSWAGMTLVNDYKERASYDANGNILTYLRQGFGVNSNMDSLSYMYNYTGGKLTNNRLNYVRDRIGNTTTHSTYYTDDIEDQAANNYGYDAIGNLTSDAAESITSIVWNVYGKITRIYRTATAANNVTQIRYAYDASGNRISKAIARSATDSIEYTFYGRDAAGNIMATYYGKDAPDWSIDTVTTGGHVKPPLYLQDQQLYGSSRLGVLNRNINIGAATFVKPSILNFTRGNKFFELSNHLSNVLVTVSDKKYGVDTNANGIIDYYTADVITANDYYPFGMVMPGRSFNAANSYRYGFNGQEKSNEIKGEGNSYTAEYWEYDSRLGRRWNLDPKPTIGLSDYCVLGNNPIIYADPKGDYFFGLFGSTSKQRDAARKLQQETGGKINNLTRKNINVQYTVWGSESDITFNSKKEQDPTVLREVVSNHFRTYFDKETGEANSTDYYDSYSNKWQSYGSISAYKPDIYDKWSKSDNFIAKATYSLTNSFYVTGQNLFTKNFGDGYAKTLTGQITTPKENMEYLFDVESSFLPTAKSVKGLTYLEKLNAAQFSKLFKGNLARLAPQTRGMVNRGLNYLFGQYNDLVPSGKFLFNIIDFIKPKQKNE